MEKASFKIEVYGLVQGVGFRPFIYTLAKKFKIFGRVFNDSSGVKIKINGDYDDCSSFIKAISSELPVLARIDNIKISKADFKFRNFQILQSKNTIKISPILADFAICEICLQEFRNSMDRRHFHPFINCTNCGPRFSIINSLPYDRKNTSMSGFEMCSECKKEYKNPLDRRYHAQPISCKVCGPKLSFKNMLSDTLATDLEAVKICAKYLKDGKIVAIKGLGGFHLVCNALDLGAIENLRIKKSRPSKPFALMCKNISMADEFAYIQNEENKLLSSNIKPIVLLKSKKNLPKVALNLNKIGIFLPPTALHYLIFEFIDFPIIATSANISSEPIIVSFDEIKNRLGNVCDAALDNDREILNPSDDSIVLPLSDSNFQWLRTSRGIKPRIAKSNFCKKGCFLALGSELKNQFSIYRDGFIFSSPYIGDIKNVATFDRFLGLIDSFVKIYDFEFDFVVGDLHPYFRHTKEFLNRGFKVFKVQHHYAHILSVMLENGLKTKVLGFGFDGTGYGENGNIWGGEVFICDEKEYKRLLHFDEFKLIGAEKSIKNIYYLAFAILKKYDIKADNFFSKFKNIELLNLEKSMKNSPSTSSLGRIFDAFSCLVLGIDKVSYEAHAAMMLESLYDENLNISYKFDIKNGIIYYKDVFIQALVSDAVSAATGFINGIADLIIECAKAYDLPVVLGGGVFQNASLTNRVIAISRQNNICLYLPKNEPLNDSGIAMGQIYFGLKFLGYNVK